ncbi:hypothetical protein Tco_0531016 [Tanacetum coccineum]
MLYTSRLLNAARKKALNLLKKGLLIRGEAVEAFKEEEACLTTKFNKFPKVQVKDLIQSMVDVPIHQEDPAIQITPLIDTVISMVTDNINTHTTNHTRLSSNVCDLLLERQFKRISKALLVEGSYKDGDGDTMFQQSQYEHVGPQDTRPQDGERSQDDDQRLDLADDLKKAQDHISRFRATLKPPIDYTLRTNPTKNVPTPRLMFMLNHTLQEMQKFWDLLGVIMVVEIYSLGVRRIVGDVEKRE